MKYFLLLFTLVFISACKGNDSQISQAYKESIQSYWAEKNEDRIYYLEVVALHKLDSFENTFGKGSNNNLVLDIEALPNRIGAITVQQDGIQFSNTEGLVVTTETDSIITTTPLALNDYGSSQMLFHDQLSWRVITRSRQHYLRVWDKENPEVDAFKGYETFELNPNMKFGATFTYYESSKSQVVKSEVDGQRNTTFVGKVTFEYDGEMYDLDVGENGFTMVADATTGETTYGGGRYIYFDLPKESGTVEIDFNKLYNPPCAFNQYTTCLYPPRQNYLPFEITAGETVSSVNYLK